MDSIMGTKKKKKASSEKKNELVQVRIEVAKPGSKKYTHVDWEELLRKQGVEKDEDMLRRFYDEDTLFMAKKLGETKSKSGKQLRVNLDHIQYLNRNCGYDMDDDFIDDTEAVDDMANVSQKKGHFYVGKGEVKTMDEDEEEEESEEEVEEVQKKPRKKYTYKDKKESGEKEDKSQESSSSDSDSEPVRMTGAPPTSRLCGGPPVKRFLQSKPTPPSRQKSEDKEKPPLEKKKKESPPEKAAPEIITIEESEPPAKKNRVEPPTLGPTTSSSSTISIASTSSDASLKVITPTTSPQKASVAQLAKKVVQAKEAEKPSTSSPPRLEVNVTNVVTKLFQSVVSSLTSAKAKGSKSLNPETIQQINELLKISQNHSVQNAKFIETFAANLGVTADEFRKIIKGETTEGTEWKLTSTDIPHFSAAEISSIAAIVKSWKSTKQFSPTMYATWLKEVNTGKLTLDAARIKLYNFVASLADKEKTLETGGQDLPKHERSRKARQFLPQWVHLSRKYVEMILPTLKKPTTDGYAQKQLAAIVSLKDAVKKQISSFEAKKEKSVDKSAEVYQFQFTDPVLTAIWAYLDELIDYSLANRSLDVLVKGIDNLHHQCLDNRVTLIQFYIELCRRLQKLSFLTVEEPLKTRLANAKEQIVKHQVVQNPKYMIKWPGGEEPSIRGFNRELSLSDFETSVLSSPKKAPIAKTIPPKAANPVKVDPPKASPVKPIVNQNAPMAQKSLVPSTSSSKPTPLATRQPTEDERRTMNQIVQVYLVKYLLANGQSTADICDPTVVPMTDDMIAVMVNAISQSDVAQASQVSMVKNLLTHSGQIRMALALQKTTTPATVLTIKDYQALFEYFQKYEKAMEAKQIRVKEAEEREARRQEEKAKKEREKQLEREKKEREREAERLRKEQEKAEEKERKEREKREEKERKEQEAREAQERKRREEEDRQKAQERIRLQMEDERRKREAAEMVEKELERRAKMESEAANALQFLEEDLLMDDVDFLSEQQTREDQERRVAEAKRAEERENQIKMMRAKQVKREEEDVTTSGDTSNGNGFGVFPQNPTTSSFPSTFPTSSSMNSESHHQNHQQNPQSFPNYSVPSTSTSNIPQLPANPPEVPFQRPSIKKEPQLDILNAAQNAAGLPSFQPDIKKEPGSPSTPSAFDQLARLRGRTMSADVKRGQTSHPNPPMAMQNPTQNTAQNPPMMNPNNHHNASPQMGMHNQNQMQNTLTHPNPQMNQMTAPLQHHPQQQLHHQNTSNNPFGCHNNVPFSAPSTSSPLHHQSPQKFFPPSPIATNPMMNQNHQNHQNQMMSAHHQPPSSMSSTYYNNGSNGQSQRVPPSYQSPSSSLMHTPMSSDFSASPMSQQFHTPPSVGMMPVMSPQQTHFNANNMNYMHQQHQGAFPRAPPQMHRQMSQQQMQQALQQQQMMRQQQHHYPPH